MPAIECPHCTSSHRVSPRQTGKSLVCPACGGTFFADPHLPAGVIVEDPHRNPPPVQLRPPDAGPRIIASPAVSSDPSAMVEFACPNCLRPIAAEARHRGERLNCPMCRVPFLLGRLGDPPEVPKDVPAVPRLSERPATVSSGAGSSAAVFNPVVNVTVGATHAVAADADWLGITSLAFGLIGTATAVTCPGLACPATLMLISGFLLGLFGVMRPQKALSVCGLVVNGLVLAVIGVAAAYFAHAMRNAQL